MPRTHTPIPRTHPVQPLRAGQAAKSPATCGHCGLSWDDGKVTSMTPAPGARCPFEEFHLHAEPRQRRTLRPATAAHVAHVERALEYLAAARTHLAEADCPQALERVRSCIKSTEGALRHIERRAAAQRGAQ